MALTQLAPPYPIFTDKSGSPLDAGYLYFGEVNKNPETNPIQVYYDSALTQPAAQPVRTINGYPSRNGSPAAVYTNDYFSITVRNKRNELVIYAPSGYGITPGTSASFSDQITYNEGSAGAVDRTLTSRLQDRVSVKDFGAVGDGVADDTLAVQAWLLSGGGSMPSGTYKITQVTVANDFIISGPRDASIIWDGGTGTNSMIVVTGAVKAQIQGVTIDGNRTAHIDTSGYFAAFDMTLTDGADIEIENVRFVRGRIHDIRAVGPTVAGQKARLSLIDCRFDDGLRSTNATTRAAQAVQCTYAIDLTATNNIFNVEASDGVSTFGRGGIVFQNPPSASTTAWGSVRAIGNQFVNMGKTPNALGCIYVYSGARGVVIQGNSAISPRGTVFAAKADQGEIVINGNTVEGQIDPNGFCVGIFDQADSTNISVGEGLVVSNNSINEAEGNGIFVDGDQQDAKPNFKSVVITGNVVKDALRGAFIRDIEGCNISGNHFQDCDVGLFMSETLSGVISINGNTFAGCDIGILGNTGATFTDADFLISDNILRSIAATALRQRSSVKSQKITGNMIIGAVTGIETNGSSGLTHIFDNTMQSVTTPWERFGSYGGLWWSDNDGSNIAFALRSLTLASDAATAFSDFHSIAGEGGLADDLITLNGGYEGKMVCISAATSGVNITVQSGGNIRLSSAGNFVMNTARDMITLLRRGTEWVEISRSDNP